MRRAHALLACGALAVACAGTASLDLPAHFARLPKATVTVHTESGAHLFEVWIAADDPSRERGLMRVRALPPRTGMLFVFDRPEPAAFWMKDTWIGLDIVFIGPDGVVLNIAERTTPLSLEPLPSAGPAAAVLEVSAGTADELGLLPGDHIDLPTLRTTGSRYR